MDIKNTSKKQFQILKEQVDEVAATAMHRLASPETVTMTIKLSMHRKISFPGKISPWLLQEFRTLDTPLNELYKCHLKFLHSAPNAALHMSKEVGGLGIIRLSDQINMDKWAMLIRGLYPDKPTSTETLGILNRSLRIGQTDTDHGYEAMVRQSGIPHHMRSLVELIEESSYRLRRASQTTEDTPSKLLTKQYDLLDQSISRKLMNYRITTLADLVIFKLEGNSWNHNLINLFPTLASTSIPQCLTGKRVLRMGQYWASSHFDGRMGRIVEIMGIRVTSFKGRSWVTTIPSDRWASHNTSRGRLLIVGTPSSMILSDSQ